MIRLIRFGTLMEIKDQGDEKYAVTRMWSCLWLCSKSQWECQVYLIGMILLEEVINMNLNAIMKIMMFASWLNNFFCSVAWLVKRVVVVVLTDWYCWLIVRRNRMAENNWIVQWYKFVAFVWSAILICAYVLVGTKKLQTAISALLVFMTNHIVESKLCHIYQQHHSTN